MSAAATDAPPPPPPPMANPPTRPPHHSHPHSHTTSQLSINSSAPIFSPAKPVGESLKLFHDKREKEMYEDMSAVFSLLTATERLENIWARRGAISQDDYERQCEKLIQQYAVLRNSTEKAIPNIDLFIAEYDCKASKARPRLKAGVPATVLLSSGGKPKDQGKFVMRCTTLFHYVGNCIEMNQRGVSFLLPDLISLMKTLNRITTLGQDFEFNEKIRWWVQKLNSMSATDELTEEDSSQLKLDLDKGFSEFESAYND